MHDEKKGEQAKELFVALSEHVRQELTTGSQAQYAFEARRCLNDGTSLYACHLTAVTMVELLLSYTQDMYLNVTLTVFEEGRGVNFGKGFSKRYQLAAMDSVETMLADVSGHLDGLLDPNKANVTEQRSDLLSTLEDLCDF